MQYTNYEDKSADMEDYLYRVDQKKVWSQKIKYSAVQYSTVRYSTVQYGTVWYSMVQYSTVQLSQPQAFQAGLRSHFFLVHPVVFICEWILFWLNNLAFARTLKSEGISNWVLIKLNGVEL